MLPAAVIGLVASVTAADAQVVVLGPGVFAPQTVGSLVCEVRREQISDERGWRVRDVIVAAIETKLRLYGIEDERLSIRITGCPNGCARPYTGDIGIVGRMPGFYALFVGGDFAGTRLNTPLVDKVPLNAIADVLEPLFGLFASSRTEREGFGDFCHRIGMPALQQTLAESQKSAA